MKKIIFLLMVSLHSTISFAQSQLSIYEDSLVRISDVVIQDSLEENRTEANYQFIKTLVKALGEKNSFYYPFKDLSDFIVIRKADDNKFRIFTWFTHGDDGTYRYFGAIQVNNPKKLELYPLIDHTQELQQLADIDDASLAPDRWLGAVYYEIVPVTGIKDPYFILLGWKGKSASTNSKIIETLKFVGDKPVFGQAALEKGTKAKAFANRVIFNYTSGASMMLRYVKNGSMIVFDHLVPPSQDAEGLTDLYAPDLSYDALKFKQGKWWFQENLPLKNLPDESDDFFIDPAQDKQNTAPVINN